jgi:hypothetical protein
MTGELIKVYLIGIAENDFDDVVFGAIVGGLNAGALGELEDIAFLVNDVFRQEETGGELFVVSGGAHHDGDAFAFDANFERGFRGDAVGPSFRGE